MVLITPYPSKLTIFRTPVLTSVYEPRKSRHVYWSPKDCWFRISRYEDEPKYVTNSEKMCELKPFIRNDTSNTINEYEILCAFDFETTEFATGDREYDRLQQPYLGYITIDYQSDTWPSTRESFEFSHYNLEIKSTVALQIVNFLHSFTRDLMIGTVIRMFGYNNFKFDNHFLANELADVASHFFKSDRNRKTSETYFYMNGCQVKFSDLVRWIPDMTLSEACKDYEVEESKMDVDIIKYNKYITEMKKVEENIPLSIFKTLVSASALFKLKRKYPIIKEDGVEMFQVYKYIKDYCLYDTLSVVELYKKLKNVATEVFKEFEDKIKCSLRNYNFTSYISPSQISGLLMKRVLMSQGYLQLRINDAAFGRAIYDSYFGGRVDYGLIGEYISTNSTIKCMDVTSQYTCAMNGNYPAISEPEDYAIGEDIDLKYYQGLLDKCCDLRYEAWKDRTLHSFSYLKGLEDWRGIFFCDIIAPDDAYNLCTFAAVPGRIKGQKKLIYENTSQTGRRLTSIHFKNLILSGYRIILRENTHNIVFYRVAPIFKSFVQLMGDIKVEARINGNKTKAKLIKLFLNSAAGKLAQKPMDVIDDYRRTSYNVESKRTVDCNWTKSLHYLAAFVTSEANWILYSCMYCLQLDYIYSSMPLSARCGSLLYMDTDSIMYDNARVNDTYYPFIISEEIGDYDQDKCTCGGR